MVCRFRKKARFLSYLLPLFISVWVFLTIYLALHRTASVVPKLDMPPDTSNERLRARVYSLEEKLRRQLDDSKKILIDLAGGLPVKPTEALTNYLRAKIAILVISCNRPLAVKNVLDQLLKLRPSKEQFPIIVSQDCSHQETQSTIESYGAQLVNIRHPDQTEITLPKKEQKFAGYYKLARHYRWALNKTIYDFGYESVIIVEDDLDLAVDFFEYFLAGNRLLSMDATLWCVSAWNDHGKANLTDLSRPDLLHRSDFFGGLGWLIQKRTWDELQSKWPKTFWDDWMRHPNQRKDRACIRPEISRTSMSLFGKRGVSKGLHFDRHLKFIRLNTVYVNFTRLDLSYLLKDNYDEPFVKMVYNSTSVSDLSKLEEAYNQGGPPKTVRFTYTDQKSYEKLADSLKVMKDAKAGVGRMAYRGVVTFMYKQTRVFLAPPAGWTGYDTRWT